MNRRRHSALALATSKYDQVMPFGLSNAERTGQLSGLHQQGPSREARHLRHSVQYLDDIRGKRAGVGVECSVLYAPYELIVRGISPDEVEAIFDACVPYLHCPLCIHLSSRPLPRHSYPRKQLYESDNVCPRYLLLYAQEWVESPAGGQDKSLHEFHS